MSNKPTTYAGLWVRTKAFALDYLIMTGYLILLAGLGLGVKRSWPTVTQTLFANPNVGHLTSFLLVTLPITLYFALLEASPWQATWGKHRLGLRVTRTDGTRLSVARALGRTALKFIPWELTHTLIWQVRFAPSAASPFITAGFVLVWVLIGANAVSLWLNKSHQTLYDWFAGTDVVAK